MAVREYLKACQDLFNTGIIDEGTIHKHIEQQIVIDKLLPNSPSFFFVVEPAKNAYHFMGSQQETVSGFTNREVMDRGMEFLYTRLHPDEVPILQEKVYPNIAKTLGEATINKNIRNSVTQFNYRFKKKGGAYHNLLEHLYVLEVDQKGRPSLFLGNIVNLENDKVLPLRLTIKYMQENGSPEILFSESYSYDHIDLGKLTKREIEVLHKLALGKTSKVIGNELSISNHTVDTHRRNLLKKLKCSSVVDLTRLAFRKGLL